MKSFWEKLSKPFFMLAPMADVTDPAFRRLIAETAKPDVMMTEFVSADGLYHTREVKKMRDEENPLARDISFSEVERPIVMQVFSSKPEMIAYATELALERGFDGLDINMGCPDRSVERQGSGASLMKNPQLAIELVRAARESARRKGEPDFPISVKTRIGYDADTLEEWLPVLLGAGVDAVTLHLRTRKEMSSVPAHWEAMSRAVAIRDRAKSKTLLIGNGDIRSLADAREKVQASGADGAMLGKAIFGNPWLFAGRTPEEVSPRERLLALARLAEYFGELKPAKHFAILKKHIKAFVTGFDGASELRARLMATVSIPELVEVTKSTDVLSP